MLKNTKYKNDNQTEREQLIEASQDDRDLLTSNTQSLTNTENYINDAHHTTLEILDIDTDIITDLNSQRETIVRNKNIFGKTGYVLENKIIEIIIMILCIIIIIMIILMLVKIKII